jgi:hypothetical protein
MVAATLAAFTSGAVSREPDERRSASGDAAQVTPGHVDEADREIAALGATVMATYPARASSLAAAARSAAGLPSDRAPNWQEAIDARDRLSQSQAIALELAEDRILFVAGWPLTHTEAGIALLFQEARVSSGIE